MYSKGDSLRESAITESEYRTPYRRDYARLLHSPSFRRLQGKTQLYPGTESDFFRNRLTHSLEVAQIAKTIALRINHVYLKKDSLKIDPDICEFAGLAHDLGHPPFGHQGEEALDDCMRAFGGFEGNAQTLRILSKLEKKDKSASGSGRIGLNLTYRTLASVLKYDQIIPISQSERPNDYKDKPIKGYYKSEHALVKKIKSNIVGSKYKKKFKTVECQIMDLADDIAYSTYDLEDGFKAGFYHPVSFFSYPNKVYENVAKKVSTAINKNFTHQDVKNTLAALFANVYDIEFPNHITATDEEGEEYIAFESETALASIVNIVNSVNTISLDIAQNGFLRVMLTSELINKAVEGIQIKFNKQFPSQTLIHFEEDVKIYVEVLKNFTFESQILSPRLKVAEYRGKEIVKAIFEAISQDEGWRLMPNDYQDVFHSSTDELKQKRCICDFIAGMTDKYAIEFYGRLKSENPETIFKPF